MSRPREHDERTAAALLEAAERIVDEDGVEALSLRRVANEVGTTTRAVYSLFGSKDGLVVALGAAAFDLLKAEIDALPVTSHPEGDLVEAGVSIFRRFALEHPALFRIGVLNTEVAPELVHEFRGAADRALDVLHARVSRLADQGLLGTHSVPLATCAFHALCEGLAGLELRGAVPPDAAELFWRSALNALVMGWRAT